MIDEGKLEKWTHSCCTDCWNAKNPDRPAHKMTEEHRLQERCCYCGASHQSGIYIRDSIDNTICDTFVGEGR